MLGRQLSVAPIGGIRPKPVARCSVKNVLSLDTCESYEAKYNHKKDAVEGANHAIFHIKYGVSFQISGHFEAPKLGKIALFNSKFQEFHPKKGRISPQIADFRHKSPVLDTFSTRQCTMLYFCGVLENRKRVSTLIELK
jgi:hypothetical protein